MKNKVIIPKDILVTIDKIFEQKPNMQIIINEDDQNDKTIKIIRLLEENALVYNIHIKEKNARNFYTYKKGDLVFVIASWDALCEFYINQCEYQVTDPFGEDKQIRTTKNIILKKSSKLENNELTIKASDFGKSLRSHIYIVPALKWLEEIEYLSIIKWNISTSRDVECKIKLNKSIGEIIKLKNKTKQSKTRKIKTSKNLNKNFNTPKQKSNSSDFLLYKDKNENYFYNNIKIDIQTNTLYFKIFNIIYSHCDQNGFISYKNIESKLVDSGIPAKEDKYPELEREYRMLEPHKNVQSKHKSEAIASLRTRWLGDRDSKKRKFHTIIILYLIS